MSVAKKIIINTFSNYLLRFLQIILSLIAIPVIINNVGKEAFGLIALANSILGYFVLIDIGIPTGVTKYVAEFMAKKDHVKVSKIINTSFSLFIGIGSFVSLSTILFVYFGGLGMFNISPGKINSAKNLLFIAAVFALFSWPRKVLEGAFQGLQQFHKVNLVLGLGRVFAVTTAIVVSLVGKPVELVFLAMNADVFVTGVWLFAWLRRELDFWHFRLFNVEWSILKLLFAFSSWLFLSQLAVLLEYNSDTIIIGTLLPVYMITAYAILMNPFRLIQQASGLAASAILPAVSESEALRGKEGVDVFIYQGVKYHNLLFAPWAIIGGYLCQPFIRLWVGPEYLQHIWIAQLACFFQLIWQSNALLGQVYLGTGRVKKLSLLALCTGIANVLLSIILVKIIGFIGVILSTICIGTVSVPIVLWLILPDLQIPAWRYLRNVLIKTQLPLWIGGFVFLPLWDSLQNINNWMSFILIASLMALVLYVAGWFFVLDRDLRGRILVMAKNPLLNFR